MKKYSILSVLVLNSLFSFAQIVETLLPGTLNVTGLSSMSQTIDDLIQEAGVDDNTVGFESNDYVYLSFVLDPTTTTDPSGGDDIIVSDSETNCTANIFLYKVYMHTIGAPQNVIIEAKTYDNSGSRYPVYEIGYDTAVPMGPLGARDLRAENGGAYIPIPNQADIAIKVFEFVGCRQDIPIQFRIKASSLAISGNSSFTIYYTIVGSNGII